MLEIILILMGIFIPPMLYAILIWITLPYSSIKFKDTIKYFIFGCISIPILTTMWEIAPDFFSHWQLGLFGHTPEDFYYTKAFLIVAWPEELAKYLAFFIITQSRWITNKFDNPMGLMYYAGMVGLSFGLVENIMYIANNSIAILAPRTFTSLVMHLLAGLIMGYFIALGRIAYRTKGRSVLSIITFKRKVLSTLSYGFFGVLAATAIHGLYDYNLFLDKYYRTYSITFGQVPVSNAYTILLLILGLGAAAAYAGAKHLNMLDSKK